MPLRVLPPPTPTVGTLTCMCGGWVGGRVVGQCVWCVWWLVLLVLVGFFSRWIASLTKSAFAHRFTPSPRAHPVLGPTLHQNNALLEVRWEKLRELQVLEAELLTQDAEQLVRRLSLRAPLAPAFAVCPCVGTFGFPTHIALPGHARTPTHPNLVR